MPSMTVELSWQILIREIYMAQERHASRLAKIQEQQSRPPRILKTPDKMVKALAMRTEGKTYREIAGVLECSISYARTLHQRAERRAAWLRDGTR